MHKTLTHLVYEKLKKDCPKLNSLCRDILLFLFKHKKLSFASLKMLLDVNKRELRDALEILEELDAIKFRAPYYCVDDPFESLYNMIVNITEKKNKIAISKITN